MTCAELTETGLHGAPSLRIEVLSPGTRGLDLEKKRLLYTKFDVPEYWIFDPDLEQITVHQSTEGRYVALESTDGVAWSGNRPCQFVESSARNDRIIFHDLKCTV